MPYYDQQDFDIRLEWGVQGLDHLAASDVIVVVDVLSFTTSVVIAVSRDATVLPYPPDHHDAATYAESNDAELVRKRSSAPGELSLSPNSLNNIQSGRRVVIPSPNGSNLSFKAAVGGAIVVAGSLRNASGVAEWINRGKRTVSLVPAGERWDDDSIRPAYEDLIGAGAVISGLAGTRSPEAQSANDAFQEAKPFLEERLAKCSSGRQLIERGFTRDVELAGELDANTTVPVLNGNAFERAT